MRKYDGLEIEIISLSEDDVIRTSDGNILLPDDEIGEGIGGF